MPRFERRYDPPPGKIIVKRHASETVTKGGLHVAPSAEKPTFTGDVIAVGEGCKIKVGDKVCYGGMYQMIGATSDKDIAVLLYPDEIMYSYDDVLVSTPEEIEAERVAKAEFEAERARPKLEL